MKEHSSDPVTTSTLYYISAEKQRQIMAKMARTTCGRSAMSEGYVMYAWSTLDE